VSREYWRAPRAPAFMARAILFPRRPGLRGGLPALSAVWRGHRVAGTRLEDFLELTGLHGHPHWPLLYPQAAGFRLLMTLLTDRRFPFPIWGALQVRNRMTLHAPLARGDILDIEARVAGARALEKGTEIDLACTARRAGALVWESVNAFYYRGRHSAAAAAEEPPAAPVPDHDAVAEWTVPAGSRARFGRITGDYNGIHLSDWYARLFGFRGAFHHPQRMLGQCLAHLPRTGRAMPTRLETWLKGPVYYGAEVALRASADRAEFALFVAGDERPAILGRLTSAS
jgi:acyl dehydratase